MMTFWHDDAYVIIYVFCVVLLGVIYLLRSSNVSAFEISIYGVSFLMFGYAAWPLFLHAGDLFWFLNAPPSLVSRIIILGFIVLLLIDVLRNWRGDLFRCYAKVAFSIFCIVAICSLISKLLLGESFNYRLQAPFSIILTAFLLIACFVAFRNSFIERKNCGEQQSPNTIIWLLVLVTLVGFFEVANDVAPVTNMMRGAIESRASSTFHNPNWFGLAVAPAVFVAVFLAFKGRLYQSFLIFSIGSLAIFLSGSRSASLVLALSLILLCILASFCREHQQKRNKSVIALGTAGIVTGILVGLLSSLIYGKVAFERYTALLERMLLWPVYVFWDNQAWQSIAGRFLLAVQDGAVQDGAVQDGAVQDGAVQDGAVIDNAYLFMIVENPLLGILLIVVMLFAFYVSIRNYIIDSTFEAAMRVSVAFFVVASGSIGQVYWAFPIWPIYAICLGYVLQPLVKAKLVCKADAKPIIQ
jgi:hypothetical protein